MKIGYVEGNRPDKPLPTKGNGSDLSGFNKVLSEKLSHCGPPPSQAAGGRDRPGGSRRLHAMPPGLVKIGTITSKNPTVSNLLINDPKLRDDCWNIVYGSQNQHKDYTCIRSGTDIYYNPDTKELLWGDMLQKAAEKSTGAASLPRGAGGAAAGISIRDATTGKSRDHPAPIAADASSHNLNEELLKAVEPMEGEAYSDVNCYELLVNGLRKIGVRYFGQHGLGRQLMERALDKGLPMNAYLNGEGLVRFSGSRIYSKSFPKVEDPVRQARKVMDEISPYLQKGGILSFSTETRGHTGIVSRKNGTWTYINSGVMDHPVEKSRTYKGVGEEKLSSEIENWFQLAARHKESLLITFGELNRRKLAAYEMHQKFV